MLTADNYHSPEANQQFMSNSQFRAFNRCEAGALHEIRFPAEQTKAMLAGAYLDSMVEDTVEEFEEEHPELFKKRGGQTRDNLYAEFADMWRVFDRVRRDPFFMEFLQGDKQTVLTGEIQGVPVKIKTDIIGPDRIVDLKTTASFKRTYDPVRRQFVSFADFWRYDIQGAFYREIYRQHTGRTLPFYLAAVTREQCPDLAVLEVPEGVLDYSLDEIKLSIQHYQAVKLGLVEPKRCEQCDYCKSTKRLTQTIDFREIGMINFDNEV